MIVLGKNALAIVNMLIFVVIFTVLAGVVLALVSSHTRLMESDIRRIKGYYASEAGTVAAIESLRKNPAAAVPSPSIEWTYSQATGNPDITKPQTVTHAAGKINATFDYTMNW